MTPCGDKGLGQHLHKLFTKPLPVLMLTFQSVMCHLPASNFTRSDHKFKSVICDQRSHMKHIYWIPQIQFIQFSTFQSYRMVLNGVHINFLNDWGRVTQKCVRNLTIIGSVNGFPPGRRHAFIWTSAGILLIGPLGTQLSKILIKILTSLLKTMFESVVFEMTLTRPQCVNIFSM